MKPCSVCGVSLIGRQRKYCSACSARGYTKIKAARLLAQYRANPEAARSKRRDYYSRTGGFSSRATRLKELYEITVEEYDSILASQGGVCAVCGRPPGSVRLCVDHDHGHAMKHGKRASVRGLIHGMPCNRFLVMKGITPAMLRGAANYLENPTAPPILGTPNIPVPTRAGSIEDPRTPVLKIEDL